VAKLQTGGGCRLMYEVAHSMMCMGVHEIRVGLVRGDRIYESWIR
jgi:hypothetical protein